MESESLKKIRTVRIHPAIGIARIGNSGMGEFTRPHVAIDFWAVYALATVHRGPFRVSARYDRFYTDDYRPEIYTPEGLRWVDAADLKSVLLRHHPELSRTGLANVRNAFEPWDEGRLDLARHPLRQWDASIQGDPAIGDRERDGG